MQKVKVTLFTASWCAQCPAAKSIFKTLSEEVSSVDWVMEDVDDDNGMWAAREAGVKGIPAWHINNGEKSILVVGNDARNSAKILDTIQEMME